MCKDGWISKIQRFSLGDGSGIRTTVFTQGCNLHCPWCHNPETIAAKGSILLYEKLCCNCGACGNACRERLINFCRIADRNKCTVCGRCEAVCPNNAIVCSGKKMSVESVFDCIMEDLPFYAKSGGGVTISGGEPLLQPEFARDLSERCFENRVSVIIDTAGDVPFTAFEKLIPFVDGFYYDIKSVVSGYEKIGGDGERVFYNLKRLSGQCDVTVRIPIIPGYNADEKCMEAIANELAETNIRQIHLLPFHRLASGKYMALNMQYTFADVEPVRNVDEFIEVFTKRNLKCEVDG